MSLVFPNEMAANSTNTALARGAFWFGLVFLAAAFVTIALIVDQRSAPGVAALLAPLVVIAIAGTVAVTPLATRSLVIVAVALLTLTETPSTPPLCCRALTSPPRATWCC